MIQFALNPRRIQSHTKQVLRQIERNNAAVLARFGAYVRVDAKRSLKKPKRAQSRGADGRFQKGFRGRKLLSGSGGPPSSHTGILRRFIRFAVESHKQSVVIGPIKLRKKYPDALPMLEYGGTTSRRNDSGKLLKAQYKPRPYMGPAFDKNKPKLASFYRDQITK